MDSYRTSSWVAGAGSALFFGQETQFWFPEMAGLDSGTEGTVAIAGIDWFAGPNGPDNQAEKFQRYDGMKSLTLIMSLL